MERLKSFKTRRQPFQKILSIKTCTSLPIFSKPLEQAYDVQLSKDMKNIMQEKSKVNKYVNIFIDWLKPAYLLMTNENIPDHEQSDESLSLHEQLTACAIITKNEQSDLPDKDVQEKVHILVGMQDF